VVETQGRLKNETHRQITTVEAVEDSINSFADSRRIGETVLSPELNIEIW